MIFACDLTPEQAAALAAAPFHFQVAENESGFAPKGYGHYRVTVGDEWFGGPTYDLSAGIPGYAITHVEDTYGVGAKVSFIVDRGTWEYPPSMRCVQVLDD